MSIVNQETRDDNLLIGEGDDNLSKDSTKTHNSSSRDSQKLPEQGEMVFALVEGEAMTEIPKDLYIPPDALEIFLDFCFIVNSHSTVLSS